MNRSYNLDPEGAAKAGVSNFLVETGKYIGVLTKAEAITSKQNTEGIEFSFKANDGRIANFLEIWTFSIDGRQLYGHAVLSAIMTCLRLKTLASRQMTVDGQTFEGFPDLCNKPIGLLLQRENYIKQSGEPGFKFNIVAPFDAKTEQTAGEILKSLPPEQLPRMIAQLRDKTMQPRAGKPAATTGASASDWTADQDIPF